tara:strand:+ start:706 stop:1404 length:699 start_codon:yes stop_codon:yes gene_type:complete
MNKSGNNMCLAILVILAIFLMYQLLCKNNNKMSGGDNHASVENVENVENVDDLDIIESDTELESNTDLDFNDPDYRNYEPVVENVQENVVNNMQDNVVQNEPEEKIEETNVEKNANNFDIGGLEDADNYYMLNNNEVSDNANNRNNKLNPSELLPADSKNMEGNNFLTASLSKSEQIIGIPTQTQRARKNYDLRSAPPNPQVEVSPWNMSTMEPDTGRLTFEIGQSHCPPCE